MPKSFEAGEKSVKEIFQGDYEFEIPNFQRPYAWTVDETETLFDDLVAAMREEKKTHYFLGSIVLIKKDQESRALVVDGQQRLSTLTMLLATMRSLVAEAAGDITRFLYKEGLATLGETNRYRLRARKEDEEFFRDFIQDPGGIEKLLNYSLELKDSRLRFKENIELLFKLVQALSNAERLNLWKFIANECSIVIISSPDFEASHRIFTILNNRGLDLAPIDILKSEILGSILDQSGSDKAEANSKKWGEIEKQLGRDGFSDLLAHIRAIYTKQKKRATLTKDFKEHIPHYIKQPIQFIDEELIPYAAVYDRIRASSSESTKYADEINQHLLWLNRVEFKDWAPPAIAYFKRFEQNPSLVLDFVKHLERLTYCLLVTQARSNKRIETYASLTSTVVSSGFDGSSIGVQSFQLNQLQKNEFVGALNGDIYDALPKARMALLLRLDSLFVDGSKEQKYGEVSLEHVLPQNPNEQSEWFKNFPNLDERQGWTNRLANLVPLHRRKNSAAQNSDFLEKKVKYFFANGKSSPFELTQQLRDLTQWTPQLLQKRQEDLLQKLIAHWDLHI